MGVGTPTEVVFVCGAGLAPRRGQCGAKMGGGEKQKEEAGAGHEPSTSSSLPCPSPGWVPLSVP